MSVRFLAFSDFHAHNFVEGSTRVPHYDGIPGLFNSRLVDACKELNRIREYALVNKINTVLFGGDLFHARSKIDVDVMNLIRHEFVKFNRYKIHVVMIPGNHDFADKLGKVHSLKYLEDLEYVLLVDKPQALDAGGIDLYCVPYSESKEELLQTLKEITNSENVAENWRPKILLGHFGIQGATVGSDYVLVHDEDVGYKEIPTSFFDMCLFGHYHEHQQLGPNSWYIGATFGHNWGDANTKRGFLDIVLHDKIPGKISAKSNRDPEEKIYINQIVSFWPPKYRKFVEGTNELNPGIAIHANDIIKFVGTEPWYEEQKKLLEGQECTVSFVPVSEDAAPEEYELPENTVDPVNMIDFWVKHQKGEEDNELISLGKSLLAKATEANL